MSFAAVIYMNAPGTASPDKQLIHRTVMVNDVALHFVEIGAGPLILLLHGFPDFLVFLASSARSASRGWLPRRGA
jgi:hypothetical protein